jgi:prolyl-tRNA synthetase
VEVVVLMVRDDPEVRTAAQSLVDRLVAAGRRVRLDDRTDTGFGRRTVDWELKGVPVRVEVGPRDLAEGLVTVVTRHDLVKRPVALAQAADVVVGALGGVADALREGARAFRDANTVDVATLDEAVEAGATGFARLPWSAVGAEGEDRLATHALSVRCLQRPDGGLPGAGDEDASLVAVVGRSY